MIQTDRDRKNTETPMCIEIDNVGMTYSRDEKSEAVKALEGITLSIKEGEFVSFVGPTGCGKTTLLKIIADITKPTIGKVTIRGESTNDARKKKQFGFIFQDSVLLPWRTAIDNVKLPLEVSGIKKEESEIRCRQLLKLVGLEKFENSKPHELSGGMQQRVSIVRALSYNPSILLMDEPFANLDELTKRSLCADFLVLWEEERKTVVLVTHNINEAVLLSDRIVVLSAHPGTVKAILEISLSRPRKIEMMKTKEFFDYTEKVMSILGVV